MLLWLVVSTRRTIQLLATLRDHASFSAATTPSKRVTARKFPEDFSWWRAWGWQLKAVDAAGGRLLLLTSKQKTRGGIRLGGTQATAAEVATPTQVRHFLTISLYLHLHPRKASAHYEDMGTVSTEAELAVFVCK